jgi:hypothetical protein
MLTSCSLHRCSPNAALTALRRCSPNATLAASSRCSPSVVPPLGYRRHRLRWGTGELHALSPTFAPTSSSTTMSLYSSKQQGDIALESVYYKCMFQVFQMFQRCFASVSHRCCKSRSGCCTCCNSYTCMFQVWVPNVSSISDVCRKCFICMLQKYI